MAIDPAEILRPTAPAEARTMAPLAGTRSQSVQRLQIGLFGLAAMILLVGLANIIIQNKERNEARVVPEAASTVAAEPTAPPARDPLAEAGVVPTDSGARAGAADASEQRGNASPAVR